MTEVLKIKKLFPDAKIHTAYTMGAIDLCKHRLVVPITNSRSVVIGTGIAIELPAGSAGMVYARSGQALRKGLAMANGVGVIDADYRGEVAVPVVNLSNAPLRITHGERIAQLVVTPVLMPDMLELDTLSDTGRGEGGFGSTGTN